MSDKEEASKKSSFSFGFSKTNTKKVLIDSKIREESTKEATEETDYVLDVNKGNIKGSKKVEVKEDLVIPCAGNTYKTPKSEIVQKKDPSDEKPLDQLTEEELAARELIQESKEWQENQDRDTKPNENLIIQNKDNEQALFEADVESRPEVSSHDDYEKIPVEGFGMGMLRGMGFKNDEGIGGFRKAKIDCIEPVIRPKGLGLGASRTSANPKAGSDKNKEELVLKKGAYVRIDKGPNKGQYGEVDGLDDETARVVVRIHGNIISVSENVIQVVDKSEFKKFKNVINKDMYEKYSEKQKEREKEWNKRPIFEDLKDNDKPDKPKKSKKPSSTWVRRNLKVRIIDKKSKYYKQKVIVTDVISHDRIEVVTDSKRVLDDIDPYDVETVIPKEEFSLIMIVNKNSEHKEKIAEMLRKDSRKGIATVRILPDKEEVLNLSYDDICEVIDNPDDY